MYLLTKLGDELNIVYSPEEKVRLGDTLLIDDIVAQVIDIQFANLPGVLEHILRKSLIASTATEEHIQPEVQSVIDLLADQRLAIAKIRGRITTAVSDGQSARVFRTGLSEFNISRSRSDITILSQHELCDALELTLPDACDFGKLLSGENKDFELLVDRLGINLITGMKGSGKSYTAKRLLLKLIDSGVLTVVFDLNAEYINLWKRDADTANHYADHFKVFTPNIIAEGTNEYLFQIPLSEITYDDFANFVSVAREQAMYLHLMQFWRQHSGKAFDLDDLERFVIESVKNELVRGGLQDRVDAAKASGLFGPNNLTNIIKAMHETGGTIVLNLSQVGQWERRIIVEFVLRKLAQLGQSKEINAVSLFLEEAQLYVEQQNMVNILTRMRHSGIFPTFITNTPRTLPDDVFTLLDNLVAFTFRNEDELRQLARTGLIDQKSILALRHLEKRQCIAVGGITSNYPLFLEVSPQEGVVMGGETRKLIS